MRILLIIIFIGYTVNAVSQSAKTIAITPFYVNGQLNDKLNKEVRLIFSTKYQLLNQDDLIHNLEGHEEFNKLINSLIADFKYSDLQEEQKQLIKSNLPGANFLIIVKQFDMRTITKINQSGIIKLKGEFLIIDLVQGNSFVFADNLREKYDQITTKTKPPTDKLFYNLLKSVNEKME